MEYKQKAESQTYEELEDFDISLYEGEMKVLSTAIEVMDYQEYLIVKTYIPDMIQHLVDEKIIPNRQKVIQIKAK